MLLCEEYEYEIFNFKKIGSKVYGDVQVGGSNNLQRLGADRDDESLENILEVFTATHKDGGTYIVGWYKKANFFEDYQDIKLALRKFKNRYIGYYAITDVEKAVLLSVDERFSFAIIPRRVKGGMSNRIYGMQTVLKW